MTGIETFVLTIISSSGVSVALAAALVWFSRNWISERIRGSIQHEYDQKLAALNAELNSRRDVQLETLRASIERESDRLRLAATSFGEGQRAAMDRRLAALDTLWSSVLSIRENTPPILTLTDILSPGEYKDFRSNEGFRALQGELSVEQISKIFKDAEGPLERIRPYVGEILWGYYYIYRALILRTLFLLEGAKKDPEKIYWCRDSGVRQLLGACFTKKEIDEFDELNFGRTSWIQQKIESKIILIMNEIISGKTSGLDAVQQAKILEIKLMEVTRKDSTTPDRQ